MKENRVAFFPRGASLKLWNEDIVVMTAAHKGDLTPYLSSLLDPFAAGDYLHSCHSFTFYNVRDSYYMPMPSIAQNLPSLILDRIVGYSIGELPDFKPTGSICICGPFLCAATLLAVCRKWQEPVAKQLYKKAWWCNVEECSCCADNRCCGRPLPRDFLHTMTIGRLPYLRSVLIHWGGVAILDGTVNETLKASPFDKMTFHAVNSLTLTFGLAGDFNDTCLGGATSHVETFCNSIRRLFPNSTDRKLSVEHISGTCLDQPFTRDLVSGFLSQATSIRTIFWSDRLNAFIPTKTSNLRRLTVWQVPSSSPVIELIRCSTLTLETLQVFDAFHEISLKIVAHDDGTPIVYPQLQLLEMKGIEALLERGDYKHDSPPGAPFPSLKRLVIEGTYPFGNDILFRGNSSTLEYLSIQPYPRTVEVLRDCSILHGDRFSALSHLNFMITYPQVYGRKKHSENYIAGVRRLFTIGSKLRTVTSSGYGNDFGWISVAVEHIGRGIEVLDIPNIRFSYLEMIHLIRGLPRLKRLGTGLTYRSELSAGDGSHSNCRGRCRFRRNPVGDAGVDGDDDEAAEVMLDSSCSGYSGYRTFVFDHLDIIYTRLDFVKPLYTQYFPLSKTLTVLDASRYEGGRMESCRMAIILLTLCPAIRRVQTNNYTDTFDPKRPSLSSRVFIERAEIVETKLHTEFTRSLTLGTPAE